jgi:hypothetical protein
MRTSVLSPILALAGALALSGCKYEVTGPHAGHYEFERDVDSDARQCPHATKEPENHDDATRSGYIDGATATLDATVTEGDGHVNAVTGFTLSAQDSGGYDYTEADCPLDGNAFSCANDPWQGLYSIKVENKTHSMYADLSLAIAAAWTDDTTVELQAIETIGGCSEFEPDGTTAQDPDECKILENFVAQDSILDDNGDPQPATMPCTNARAYKGTWVPPDTAATE